MPIYRREELYDLVWKEPRLALAKKMCVSDVAIRKACVRAGIPVPGLGYWARKEVGKAHAPLPLPIRSLGQDEFVAIGISRYDQQRIQIPEEVPPRPEFPEPIESLKRRASVMLGKVQVPRGLDRMVPSVHALVEEDSLRKAALEKDRYSWKKPRYESVAAQRRLRIVNALLLILEKAGCTGRVGEDLCPSIRVGDTNVSIELTAKGQRERNHWQDRSLILADESKEVLTLTIAGRSVDNLPTRWSDLTEVRLERLLPEICENWASQGSTDTSDKWEYAAGGVQCGSPNGNSAPSLSVRRFRRYSSLASR